LATTVERIFDRSCAAAPDAIALLYRGENTGKLLIHVD
jgi:NADPH-dependent curcumin reductase CurA